MKIVPGVARLLPALLFVVCAACTIGYRSGEAPGTQTSGGRVALRSDNRVLAGVVVTVLMAEGVRYYLRGEDGSLTALRHLPPPDPFRRVNEQDCARPFDPMLGNLVCR